MVSSTPALAFHSEVQASRQAFTFLTSEEIVRIHNTFRSWCPELKDPREEKLTLEQICTWPELKSSETSLVFQDLMKININGL
ncbi:calcium and integrin-binding family member 4-like [Lepidochelys kempii]|uniref:calcium and integrin-binding family member 4-like n=1 Tax=Lepidochelys kempii TaxID=8472 RepID=UPI003C6F96E8